MEPFMWRQVRKGSFSFWFDNWTKLGALYYIEEDLARDKEVEVKGFM